MEEMTDDEGCSKEGLNLREGYWGYLFISLRYRTVSGCSDFMEALKLGFLSGSSFFMRMMEEVSDSSGMSSPEEESLRSYILMSQEGS